MALPRFDSCARGEFAGDWWELTIEVIHRSAPELTAVPLDMPERRNKPGDMRGMTIADFPLARRRLHPRQPRAKSRLASWN